MKLFTCKHCGQLLFFENFRCTKCGHTLGFFAESLEMFPLVEEEGLHFIESRNKKYASTTSSKANSVTTLTGKGSDRPAFRYCTNHDYNVCNWIIPQEQKSNYCLACSLNRTIPNLQKPEYLQRWNTIESAKHRLVYTLLRMKLPVFSKEIDPKNGLSFDFIADEETGEKKKVLTGHAEGLITINIAEADDIEREMARRSMDEVYRTVLGHFRHEIGHYYWDRLIANTKYHEPFRQIFGDESEDYGEALKRHYSFGVPAGWNEQYISTYSSAHPWEDWAETWAHYLHIIDTLETAYAFGLSVHSVTDKSSFGVEADVKRDPYEIRNFDAIMALWLPLTITLNSLNRSMGHRDVYPFIIPRAVMHKLKFIHQVLTENRF